MSLLLSRAGFWWQKTGPRKICRYIEIVVISCTEHGTESFREDTVYSTLRTASLRKNPLLGINCA